METRRADKTGEAGRRGASGNIGVGGHLWRTEHQTQCDTRQCAILLVRTVREHQW